MSRNEFLIDQIGVNREKTPQLQRVTLSIASPSEIEHTVRQLTAIREDIRLGLTVATQAATTIKKNPALHH